MRLIKKKKTDEARPLCSPKRRKPYLDIEEM